ncbi:MAG: ATP-dependent Clp protease proteolytic subunit [Xenococcaceae cyanobacterium MO_207.B15]|nr:ATP-dependent Clp protease proteolytic subunit [Xenococcaceae cyanobacterium MO_207.B15]
MTVNHSSDLVDGKLIKQRIIFLGQAITDDSANFIVKQLLFLEEQDETKEIYLYINSPGGSVIAGFKIYDTIQNIKPDVVTVCVDLAAGMAGLLLAAGTRDKRICLSNSKVMLCQIQGAVKSEEQAQEILSLKQRLNKLLAFHTGQKVQQIEQDTETDFFLSPKDAKKYGIVDAIIDEHNHVIAQIIAILPSKNQLNSSTNNSVEDNFVATASTKKVNSKIVDSEREEHQPKIKDTSKSKHTFESNENGDKKLQRIFPPIQRNIYQSNSDFSKVTPDEKVALKLLDLSNKKLNKVEKLFGCNLDAQGKLSRLLDWHRSAIETELAGQWKQAGFYWKQVQIEIQKLAKQDKLWSTLVKELANEPGVVVMNDPVKMRQRLVEELFIDTHYNFYHSIAQQSGKLEIKEQAFMHIKYLEGLVNLSSFSDDDLLAHLDYPWQKQINIYIESEKWTEAYLVCKSRLIFFPYSIKFQNELIEMRIKAILAILNNSTSRKQLLKDIKDLKQEIIWFRKLIKIYPNNMTIFQFIAILYSTCAIKLNNSKQVSKAILYIEKALNYNPDFAQAYRVKQQLEKQMNQLQASAKEINNKLFSRKQTVISAEGKWILKEASTGFSLRNNYQKSSEFKAIADAYCVAKTKYPNLLEADISNNVIIPNTLQKTPVFKPEFNSVKLKNEPFLPWLFSHQDLRFKMLPAFASLLLLISGGFVLRESFASSVRNRAYQEILEASQKYDSLKVIENAEQFLTHKSVKGKDSREGEVQKIYAQALVQWLSEKGEQLDNTDWKIINRYQRLNNNQ